MIPRPTLCIAGALVGCASQEFPSRSRRSSEQKANESSVPRVPEVDHIRSGRYDFALLMDGFAHDRPWPLRRDGIASVRAGILAAVPFERNSGDHPPNPEHEHEKQADVIIRLARTSAQLFHGADGTAFVDVRVGNHRETWPVRSRGFRLWLTREYYKDRQSAPNSDAMQCALNVLEATARFDGSEEHVSVRIGGIGGKIYIDLGNKDWSAIEIDSDGWRIVAEPPVRFRRSKGMLALPIPRRGGNINLLRAFLNLKTDVDFLLVVSWLVAALRDRGPYPVLALIGEHGTAKSTLTRVLRALVDPNSTSLRSLPRDDRDLFISANNGYVMAFDKYPSCWRGCRIRWLGSPRVEAMPPENSTPTARSCCSMQCDQRFSMVLRTLLPAAISLTAWLQ